MASGDQHARDAARKVARASYGKLVAYLAKHTRDVAAAEDALSEAFAAALADWPLKGVPERPEAWLVTVARRRHIDAVRRRSNGAAGSGQLLLLAEEFAEMNATPSQIPDQRLELMFACAHPAIDEAVRSPLILQAVLGMNADEIASAFLVSPAAMGQRLARAKAKIKLAGIPFRVPERAELAERLDAVLEAVYAAYAKGWKEPLLVENSIADEAIWLGRVIVGLLPDAAEALGLLALMLFLQSRRAARRGIAGEFVPLSEQDMALWHAGMIEEAESLLARAAGLAVIGRYQLEAAIQSVHAARRQTNVTDWQAILELYDGLVPLTGSMVIALNRAIALAEISGAQAGLAALDAANAEQQFAQFQPYWATRAELLSRLQSQDAAVAAYDLAIGLETDPAQRLFLLGKRDASSSASNLHGPVAFPRPKGQT